MWLTQSIDCYAVIYIFPLKTDLKKVKIYKPALSQTEGTTQSITTSSLKENVRAIWLLPRNKGTSSSGGGHAKFLMIIVTDGHASHDCAKFAELYTFKGVFIFGWFTRILRNCFNFKGLFNKSKPTIVCLETYPFYSMINLSSSVILNKLSRFKRTITQRKFLVSLGEMTRQKKLNYKTWIYIYLFLAIGTAR